MNIRNTYILVFSCILSQAGVCASASIAGWGRVSMQGAIINAACSIAADSREQVIDIAVDRLANVIRDGQGIDTPFSIKLVNCVTKRPGKAEQKQFRVTFDGDADGDSFGLQGRASGIALQISDSRGHVAIPGKPLPPEDIIPVNMQLDYKLKLVANNKPFKVGDYFSVVHFKIEYF